MLRPRRLRTSPFELGNPRFQRIFSRDRCPIVGEQAVGVPRPNLGLLLADLPLELVDLASGG